MKGCYSKGGKIKPKTIHGLRTGQHNNPNVLRAARACGGGVMHKDGERPQYANGGRLNAAKRDALPAKDFAGPDRSYPINDANHARNALARASQHASPELQAKIKAKVSKKYPGIKQGG